MVIIGDSVYEMSDNILSVEHLSWSVASGKRRILHDISFDIPSGAFVGLIGPNGAGKSSLMRCLYGVHHPQSGTVTLQGRDLFFLNARQQAQKISVILQEHASHMGLTVWDVAAQGLIPHKGLLEWETKQDKLRIKSTLEELDLWPLRHHEFESLSGGEKQRVMLARAQIQQPELLIMDEPTNHLDVHYQIDLMNRVKAMGISVLASIHDLNIAAAFCDHLLVMDKGRIIASGSPNTVLTENLVADVFHACVAVDRHPFMPNETPRITYAYQTKTQELNDRGES